MFLKSLTLKGFKSFAEKTELTVEPGITVIVGPNGSGKSNVVDALAWVLGTHAPSKVRSGTMADVIFAGSPTRPALGRAHVEIVIDNSAGVLGSDALGIGGSAQEFSEVRISREVMASGENTYRINGEECRALDVQELLSDTGLGKEMHTIIGQGQLDAVLNAKPEERRALIEEAAGILKHRRRRERASRKLDQVDVHIDKLTTVLRELRRQLRPLERQAEAANQHAALQAQLREIQLRLAAHRLAVLRTQRSRGADSDAHVADRLAAAEQALVAHREREAAIEAGLEELAPRHEQAQGSYYELNSLLERLRGTGDLIEAKRRHLIEYVEEPLAGRPPAELRGQAERLDAEREQRLQARTRAKDVLELAVAARRDAEAARRAHEQELAAEARRRAEQRERILRWEGEVSALRGSIASAEAETGRVAAQLQGLDGRIAGAESDVGKVQQEIQRLDRQEVALTEELEAAEQQVDQAQGALDAAVTRERELERDRASQAARGEALRAALRETASGAASLLEASLDGVVGLLADHGRVAP
ncbi:MAG TPA: AAA family ATPase, partial [Nitriliruptorales bacterium]